MAVFYLLGAKEEYGIQSGKAGLGRRVYDPIEEEVVGFWVNGRPI